MDSELRPWRYDGELNADHFSGDVRLTKNGSGVMVDFRANGEEWRVWVNGAELRELLRDETTHLAAVVVRASGYARDGALLRLEPGTHLRWQDNYEWGTRGG